MQFLEGLKTYIVAFATILYAVVHYWVSAHTSADLNAMALEILGALGLGSLRATLDSLLASIGLTIPKPDRSATVKRAMRRAGHFAPMLLAALIVAPFLSGCAAVSGWFGGVLQGEGVNVERALIAAKGLQSGWIAVCIDGADPHPGFCTANRATAKDVSANLAKAARCAVGAYEGGGLFLDQCEADLAAALSRFAPLTTSARMEHAALRHAAFDVGQVVQILTATIQVATALYNEIAAATAPTNADLDALVLAIEAQDQRIQLQ